MTPFRIHFSLLLLLLLPNLTSAQNQVFVRFDDLKFNSEFERTAFSDIQKGQTDFLPVFLAVSPLSDSATYLESARKINQEAAKIQSKKFLRLKDEKKVSLIYDRVNEDILKLYEEKVLFTDVLSSGRFNCLTASAFYGFLFSQLGIEFEIRETSNHVHPVAFPQTLQIKVETTDPVNGYKYFDARLKNQFVNYLLTSKIISKDEAGSSSIDNIFNKYYFPESSIGMKELAGLQYLNDALYFFGRENFEESLKQIQKAYFLYPSDRISTVMLFILSRNLNEARFSSVEEASLLVYTARYVGRMLDEKAFINEFLIMTEKVLAERSQVELYDQICEYLISSLDSENVRKSIQLEYNYQKGLLMFNTFRIKDALGYFEEALKIKPEDINIQTLTLKCLALSFGSASNQETLNILENIGGRFPVLEKNESFVALLMLAYLQLGEEKFDFEKPLEGELLLKEFEKLFIEHPGIGIQYEEVGKAYSAAAAYYFRRNEKRVAGDYLKRGLEIAPGNYQLMYRLRAIEQ